MQFADGFSKRMWKLNEWKGIIQPRISFKIIFGVCSSVWSEHLTINQGVEGSNPSIPVKSGECRFESCPARGKLLQEAARYSAT